MSLSSPSSRCVLVLEDSVLVAMAIEAALADRGYEAILAGTLAAAHERLGHALPVAALDRKSTRLNSSHG